MNHHNASKTACPRGHPYTEENTKYFTTKTGVGRQCRQCQREILRRRAARRAGRNFVQTIQVHTKDLKSAYQDVLIHAVPPAEVQEIIAEAEETQTFLEETARELRGKVRQRAG